MKVLAFSSYPTEAASTRYRLEQFVAPLAARGISMTIRPYLNSRSFERLYQRKALSATTLSLVRSTLRRLTEMPEVKKADVILVQREAMLFGPPVIEWLTTRFYKRPMVLDLDDATYVPYTSPTYGRLGTALKWFSKTDDLIQWSALVTCGNRAIAEYVSSRGAMARVIPTVVNTEIFRPASHRKPDAPVVLGWIGTQSAFPYLKSIFGVLEKLAKSHRFKLRIVGSGQPEVSVPGVGVENVPWSLAREVEDFRSIDVGLYPIDASLYSGNWAAGKSGFKAIQYMSVGIPYVATPVGASAEIGEAGKTHLFASSNDEWHEALASLISDAARRQKMGAAAREHAIANYALAAQADKLAAALREAARN